jgi:hypothetical protein
MKSSSERFSQSKPLVASSVIATIMSVVFLLEKMYLPQSENGLTIPPLLDAIIFIVMGLSLSFGSAQYSYRAWSLDLRSFTEWCACQQIISNQSFLDWYNGLPGWNVRTLYRLMGPIGFLFGIVLAVLGFMLILAPVFAAQ